MYESHFGLRQRPFPAVPDSAFYYPAGGHEQALATLGQGLATGEGLVLLTAEPGLGKTLLAHFLVERLGPEAVPIVLTGGRLRDAASLLQAVLFDLALPYEGRSEQELRLAVVDALLKTFKNGGRTVLIVDEAHHLSWDLLEELRLLGNLEARGGKALQVVLLGLPPVLRTLRRPDLAALRQRLIVRASLQPLTPAEALDYLTHHVKTAGGQAERLVAADALDLLARSSGGIPRLLNQAAHQAFLLAFEGGASLVDVEAAHGALEVLGLSDVGGSLAEEADGESGEEAIQDGELLPLGGGNALGDEDMPGIAPRRYQVPGRSA